MIHIIIGSFITILYILFSNHFKKKYKRVSWWKWILIILWFIYNIFVCEVIIAFIQENSIRGALVNGLIFGFMAVISAVLFVRFILPLKTK